MFVIRNSKTAEEIIKTISYRLQFIDIARLMASLLSNLVNNRAEGIHKMKCKYRHSDKKCETFVTEYKDYGCCCKKYKC